MNSSDRTLQPFSARLLYRNPATSSRFKRDLPLNHKNATFPFLSPSFWRDSRVKTQVCGAGKGLQVF